MQDKMFFSNRKMQMQRAKIRIAARNAKREMLNRALDQVQVSIDFFEYDENEVLDMREKIAAQRELV